jgi:hypothetical protein
MAHRNPFFAPSDRALAFGQQYAEVLAKWGALFAAASNLVQANVELGGMAGESAKEFDRWLRGAANVPWSWLDPDTLQSFMQNMNSPTPKES